MTPSARLAAAAGILDMLDWSRPVEPQLRAWARGNRFAGSKDRRAIADRVYDCIRRRRSLTARMAERSGRALVMASLADIDGLKAEAIAALCTGGYGLDALSTGEHEALARAPEFTSEAERLDWPEWLWPQTEALLGADTPTELSAMRQRAPVDLRVNRLRGDIDQAEALLRADGLTPERLARFPDALRLPPGAPVARSAAFVEGLVEPQDAGSQAVAALLEAQPGETVLDYCAGGGGKTLALAAAMENRGTLLAYDVQPGRMTAINDRAARAGARIIQQLPDPADLARHRGKCDRVLVDAPCSGSGSWRRDPMGKWRLTPQDLDTLQELQAQILRDAFTYLRPGGVLVYATCSILQAENEAQITRFLANTPKAKDRESLYFRPGRDGCDGFFGRMIHATKD